MATIDELRKVRLKKLEAIKKAGLSVYPENTKRTHKIEQVLAEFNKLEKSKKEAVLVGRIKSLREHGGSTGGNGVTVWSNPTAPFSFETFRYCYGGGGGGGSMAVGGAGAGLIWIEANSIVWGGSGLISANGVAGGTWSWAEFNVGGGGGGGSIQVVYKTKSGSSNIQVNGGAGGVGGYGEFVGGAGATGLQGEFGL